MSYTTMHKYTRHFFKDGRVVYVFQNIVAQNLIEAIVSERQWDVLYIMDKINAWESRDIKVHPPFHDVRSTAEI